MIQHFLAFIYCTDSTPRTKPVCGYSQLINGVCCECMKTEHLSLNAILCTTTVETPLPSTTEYIKGGVFVYM